MAKATRIIRAVTLALTTVVGSTADVRGAERDAPTIVVRIDDRVDAPAEVWRIAEQEATRIFRAAGVVVAWAHGTDRQRGDIDSAVRFSVVVLNDAAVEATAVAAPAPDIAGTAVRGAGRVYIYYPRVRLAADRHARHAGTVLGMVIAHELGHLLLPPNSHSFAGIMRADLDFGSRLPDEFINSQAAAIRTAVSERIFASPRAEVR